MSAEAEPEQRPEPTVLRSLLGQPGTPLNTRKDRVYFVANPSDQRSSLGLQTLLDSGWHRVNHKKGDVERLRGGATQANGDVTWMGQVLLWISLEDYKAINQEIEQGTAELFERVRGPGGVGQVVDVTGKPASNMEEGEA